jgi:2',3'-cyclic-nucleotide 2'-phosphodiesterase (5'-nucleotidase family)
MKPIFVQRCIKILIFSLVLISGAVMAAPVATATADIENAAPGRSETAWGRLVSDALRDAGKADLALVNAGSLTPGMLKAGTISQAQIDALISFPEDDVVVLDVQGASLRAAVELSLRAYPTSSPAFLHGSGWEGAFNPQAPAGKRLNSLKINGQDVSPNSTYQVAMPISLAQGTNGYFAYWSDASARSLKTTISKTVADYLSKKHVISPDTRDRLKAQ